MVAALREARESNCRSFHTPNRETNRNGEVDDLGRLSPLPEIPRTGEMLVKTSEDYCRRRLPGRDGFAGVCRGHHRRRLDIRVPAPRQVGRCVQEGHRCRPQLSIHWFRRRHQADHEQNRHLRRLRHAADAGRRGEDHFVQFPIINGAVVPVVNLPGIKAGELVLDGPTLANIYLGKITKWNDPAIAKLNPASNFPARLSWSFTVPTVPAPRSSGPTIFRRSALTGKPGRRQHRSRMAGRHRRERQ